MERSSACPECGEAPVSHALHRAQFIFDESLRPLIVPIELLGEKAVNLALLLHIDEFLLPLCHALARARLGTLSDEWTSADSIRTKALYEGAREEGVELFHFRFLRGTRDGFFIARKDGKTLVFSTMPRPRRFHSPSVDWMDDKGRLKTYLLRSGIPTADGGVARTREEALALFERIGPPLVAKPHRGTRGRHTTIGIKTREEMVRAFDIARELTPKVIVEKELVGTVHRVTLIGGKVMATATREYPHVEGDGVSTVSALLDAENADRRRDGFSFFKIERSARADAQLAAQELLWDSIPPRGRKVILNDKMSRLHGTIIVDVSEMVHPDNIALFERLASVLGDPLIGVDFMITDMARSWKEQAGCGLVECNAMPYIDLHHYPYEGKPRPVAARLWEHVFKQHR